MNNSYEQIGDWAEGTGEVSNVPWPSFDLAALFEAEDREDEVNPTPVNPSSIMAWEATRA